MKPYWQSSDGLITVYHARFEDVLAADVVPVRKVALVHDDPPYGQNERTERARAGRGRARGGGQRLVVRAGKVVAQPKCRDWPSVVGDDRPHDPAPLLALQRPLVTWGAQRYADKLPVSPSWLWWDKLGGATVPDDNGDGELAWTNLGGPPRAFPHLWKGFKRASEGGSEHLHPTQKPIALCSWVYQRAKLKRGDLVFVPHGGSGPDLPACAAMGLRLIWCDVERWCCDTAIARLNAVTPERAADLSALPLFTPRSTT